ncbi:MAG: alpha/beta fold hydrolase [Streptosporangiaceae bacterium]
MKPPPAGGPPPGGAPGPASERYSDVASYRLEPGRTAPGHPAPGRAAPTAVLMLHGLGGDRGQLWPYAGGDQARTRLAPDLRAHGATMLVGDPEDFTFAGLTADLTVLLDRLRFPPAVVVGMSMGAGVAVALALREPSRVRGLVLIRPAWLDTAPPPSLLPLMHVGSLLRRYGTEAGLARFTQSAEYARVRQRSAAAAGSLIAQFSAPHAVPRSVRLTHLPCSTPFRRIGDLRQVQVPSLVIGARADPQHPFEMARIWASGLPGSQLVEAPRRDADPAGYLSCLTEASTGFAAVLDGGPGGALR